MDNFNLRYNFISFFQKKQHQAILSSPLLNVGDPQLLFVNAGMNPLKDYFLGHDAPPAPRLVNSQKCLRVSGKHNDLEEVGRDTYHHTFFEMLGNWSFGDYFKEEAIAWAWAFLVDELGLPKEDFYVTVFEGSPEDGLEADKESAQLWRAFLPLDHILFFGKKDNFWEMGAQGLCGPCTELHIDLRTKEQKSSTSATQLINTGHPEVVELWNLVFMQYDRRADGSLSKLPQQHVDTGMGFERLCMVMQQKRSTYGTDLFAPLISEIETKTGFRYGTDAQKDVAFRVIADHLRALVFTISDGVLPGPSQAGYVLRRLLRRATRYAYTFLDKYEPFIYEMVPSLLKIYEDKKHPSPFPELSEQQDLVSMIIQEEERMFLRTLKRGIERFSVLIDNEKKKLQKRYTELYDKNISTRKKGRELAGKKREFDKREEKIKEESRKQLDQELEKGWVIVENLLAKKKNLDDERENNRERLGAEMKKADRLMGDIIRPRSPIRLSGSDVFELYDTYGFPVDLTRLMARELTLTIRVEGFSPTSQYFDIDEEGYKKAREAQRARARKDAEQEQDDWQVLVPEAKKHSVFVGYEQLEVETRILRYRAVTEKSRTTYELLLEHTPFYPEGGGQLGDRGFLYIGEDRREVLDTQKVHGMIVHRVEHLPKSLDLPIRAAVDVARRAQTASNHTATHLLHAALREVLGSHVEQRGSYVGPEGLRFDFSHYERSSPQQLSEIEARVNEKIRSNIPLQEEQDVPIEEAKSRGARALFGEKYDSKVRVITFDSSFSVELCGGTHVSSTGTIGLCFIRSERAVAAGIRRIEALTGTRALEEMQAQRQQLQDIQALLKHPKDLKKTVEQRLEADQLLKQQLTRYQAQALQHQKQQLITQIERKPLFQLLIERVNVDETQHLRSLCFEIAQQIPKLVAILVTEVHQKPYLAVFIDKTLLSEHNFRADELCKNLAHHIEGKGGGQSFFAMAGGKNTKGIDPLLTEARAFF